VLYADWAQGLGWPNPYYVNPDFTPHDGIDQSAGICIILDHGPFATLYAHCDQTGLNPGDKVALGEIIGQTGNTGFSTGPHLHFEVLPDRWDVKAKYYGRVNPELYIGKAVALKENERLAGPLGVKGRREPRVVEGNEFRLVPPGGKEVFDRWRNGEVISGIGLWYGDGDGWYWAGGFETQTPAGLRDDNPGPAPVQPAGEVTQPWQRITGSSGAQRRSLPDKNAAAIGERFGGDTRLDFRGYVRRTDPYGDGNNVWFVGKYGEPTYFWSGSFTLPGTDGLADLTAELFPAPAPDAPAPVEPLPYAFALDFPVLNGLQVEYQPAHLTNVDVGNFPAKPSTAVCHWWNSPDVNPRIAGVIAEFQRKEAYKSAHFLVDWDRIVQMVSLADRAYHAGKGGNDWVGIEISPFATEKVGGQYTARAKAIQANVRALLAALRDRKGYKFALTLHKNVPGAATSCSELDLSTFEVEPPVVVPLPPTVPLPPVVVPPVVVPEVQLFTAAQVRQLAGLADYLNTINEK
jgi:hypothetical protein